MKVEKYLKENELTSSHCFTNPSDCTSGIGGVNIIFKPFGKMLLFIYNSKCEAYDSYFFRFLIKISIYIVISA